MCTVLLPPGVNPIEVKYIISYRIISYDSQQGRRLFHSANCPVQLWKLPNLLFDWHQGLINQSQKSPQGESGHSSPLHVQFTSPTPYDFHSMQNDNFTFYFATTIRSDNLFHT